MKISAKFPDLCYVENSSFLSNKPQMGLENFELAPKWFCSSLAHPNDPKNWRRSNRCEANKLILDPGEMENQFPPYSTQHPQVKVRKGSSKRKYICFSQEGWPPLFLFRSAFFKLTSESIGPDRLTPRGFSHDYVHLPGAVIPPYLQCFKKKKGGHKDKTLIGFFRSRGNPLFPRTLLSNHAIPQIIKTECNHPTTKYKQSQPPQNYSLKTLGYSR